MERNRLKAKSHKVNAKRAWEVWHNAKMAAEVNTYWKASEDERRYRRILARIVKEQMQHSTDSILEVGCGTGLVYEALLEAVGPDIRYTGVDNSKAMLAIGEAIYREGQFEHGDAFQLEYPDGAFALACAFEVFGHMPDCSGPIAELVRVARHAAIFTTWVTMGKEQTKGSDHYEYTVAQVNNMLAAAVKGKAASWTMRDLGASRAYVVRKA